MIAKTALAFAAAVVLASVAALMVWAAGGAIYLALAPPIGGAGAAACVAGAAAIVLLAAVALAGLRDHPHETQHAPPYLESLVSSFTETVKERPLLTLALTVLTGVAATRDTNLLKDLWTALLHKHDPHGRG